MRLRASVPAPEAKTRGTMHQTDDVLFAADVAENIPGQRLIFHVAVLGAMPVASVKNKKPENDPVIFRGPRSGFACAMQLQSCVNQV
ncbi:hypothetical protein PANA5342_1088 [Pantoea ananatis LMG 5342]|nr:hypothetical protein PANA5342_1088 [Pantoea ananatis LMG 5342]